MKSPLGRLDVEVWAHYQDKIADLIRREKPQFVIETGLETGFGAEFILKALDDNNEGHLWSVDPVIHKDFADNPIVHPRFTLVQEMSQTGLDKVYKLAEGNLDFFIHDSDHDPACQDFEYEWAWNHVRPGGIIVSDDPFWGEPPHHTWRKFLTRHNVFGLEFIAGNSQWFRRP